MLSNDAGLIDQVLDAGADSVIVPMLNSVEMHAALLRPAVARRWASEAPAPFTLS